MPAVAGPPWGPHKPRQSGGDHDYAFLEVAKEWPCHSGGVREHSIMHAGEGQNVCGCVCMYVSMCVYIMPIAKR